MIVISQAPMIERTVTAAGISVELNELEMIPVAREPWSHVARAPGVLTDREPGTGAADPPRFSGHGAMDDQNVVRIDGFEITDPTSADSFFELAPQNLREVKVVSGGNVEGASTAGLQIDLTTSEVYNTWRGSGRYQGAGSDRGSQTGNRLRRATAAAVELGGRLKPDRLFFWGAYADSESERDAPKGACLDCEPPASSCSICVPSTRHSATELDHAMGKLQALYASNFSLSASWHRGSARDNGHGAGPGRTPEATWDHDAHARLLALDSAYVMARNGYVSAGYGELDRRFGDLPRGGLGGDVATDVSGVTAGTAFARMGERDTEDAHVLGGFFFGISGPSHELKIGLRRRRYATADRWAAGGARWVEAGSNVTFAPIGGDAGASSTRDILTLWHDSAGETDFEHRAGWLQDTFEAGRLVLIAGLRWDQQRGTNRVDVAGTPGARDAAVATAEWRSFTPRLGLTLVLDEQHRTLLRAAYGRYTSRLGPALASRLGDAFPVYDRQFFTDADGDLSVDSEEEASRVPWYGVRPDLLAPDLGPELTDEALLGLEWEARYRFAVGVTLTHRASHDLLERRLLVRESGSSAPRQATAADWLPAGSLTGILPGGETYEAFGFDLAPGLELVPSGLWINGDRRRQTLTASVTWRGRLGDRWRTRGHLSWNDARWHFGTDFSRFDDPTDVVGSGDDDGDRVVELRSIDRLGSAELAVDSRWSFQWSAGVELPWDLDLGLAVSGREGYPLPYFRRLARDRAGLARVALTDHAGARRAPSVVTVDVRLAKELIFSFASKARQRKSFAVALALEAFNLLDADVALRRELDLGVGRGGAVDETATPRSWRIGLRLSWR